MNEIVRRFSILESPLPGAFLDAPASKVKVCIARGLAMQLFIRENLHPTTLTTIALTFGGATLLHHTGLDHGENAPFVPLAVCAHAET